MIINEKQTLVVRSKPESLRQVENFVDEICDYFNIHNNYFGNILMTVVEACNNAMVHGNQLDESKNVTLSFYTKDGNVCFSISDEGYGFDPTQITDPTEPENNPEKGRGIFLMKSLSDNVTFWDNGSTVELTFSVSTINNNLAKQRSEELSKHLQGIKNKIEEEEK